MTDHRKRYDNTFKAKVVLESFKNEKTIALLVLIFIFSLGNSADAGDEATLFDGRGKAVAYIVLDDDFTIYLWSGKPVAYLDRDSTGVFMSTDSMENILVGFSPG